MVLGDATTKAVINSEQVVRDVVKDVKYDSEDAGLDWRTMNVIIGIDEPSIEAVISSADTYRPHESCVVTGYACNDTPEMQPLSYKIAETVATALAEVRKDGSISGLRPDGSVQVTVEYSGSGAETKPARISAMDLRVCHAPEKSHDELDKQVREQVLDEVLPKQLKDAQTRITINAEKRFTQGGPGAHAGASGRLQLPYGATAAAAAGQSGTLVKRAGSLAARWMAKSLVGSGACTRAQVQLSYTAGVVEPVAVTVDSYSTSSIGDDKLAAALQSNFPDMSIAALVEALDLRQPRFLRREAGKDPAWEVPKPLTQVS
jgi:S-adenosylmethionine synthetase